MASMGPRRGDGGQGVLPSEESVRQPPRCLQKCPPERRSEKLPPEALVCGEGGGWVTPIAAKEHCILFSKTLSPTTPGRVKREVTHPPPQGRFQALSSWRRGEASHWEKNRAPWVSRTGPDPHPRAQRVVSCLRVPGKAVGLAQDFMQRLGKDRSPKQV